MTISKKFVTIFPEAKDVHLRKSLGKIPYLLHREYGLEAFLVCFNNESLYPSLQKDTKGLKLYFLNNWLRFSPLIATLLYLIFQARKIDFLMLYGQSRWTFFVGLFFKILNKEGKLLFKADMNLEYLAQLQSSQHFSRHYKYWHYYFNVICTTICAEYPSLKSALIQCYSIPEDKIIVLPNGVDRHLIDQSGIDQKSLEEKQNIILVVSRVGAPEKNHELILNAALSLDLKDWQIHFVGTVEKKFTHYIQNFFSIHPDLKQKIIFEPHIDDYLTLCQRYNNAKVFCLSSSREGFPVVIPEAMFWGNCIVSTSVSAMPDILEQGKLGFLFKTDIQLVEILQSIIDNPTLMHKMTEASTLKAREQYVWEKIITELATHMHLNQ